MKAMLTFWFQLNKNIFNEQLKTALTKLSTLFENDDIDVDDDADVDVDVGVEADANS